MNTETSGNVNSILEPRVEIISSVRFILFRRTAKLGSYSIVHLKKRDFYEKNTSDIDLETEIAVRTTFHW